MATATADHDISDDQTGMIRGDQQAMLPSAISEQQRAITEIQAALTVAKRFPRDEQASLDRILISCQRVRVAEEAEYSYNRGGTEVTGPTIKLLEVIAQHWGNIEFGFREMVRHQGVGGANGESVMEAFAWDLQSNTRRKAQFTVQHVMGTKAGPKRLTDPRDVYEHTANQAQRRVRTCLENIIPRDIIDEAIDQCQKTLKEKAPVTPEGIKKLVDAFAKFKVTKEDIERRLQRHLDTMTSAQLSAMRRIYKSLDEGMSTPEDWFKPEDAGDGARVRKSDLNEKVGPTANGKKSEADKPKEAPGEESQVPPAERKPEASEAPTVSPECQRLLDKLEACKSNGEALKIKKEVIDAFGANKITAAEGERLHQMISEMLK